MVETNSFGVSTYLLFNLVKYKCFQELTEQFALVIEFGSAAAKETASQASIPKMKFGTFDESLDAIAEPGR